MERAQEGVTHLPDPAWMQSQQQRVAACLHRWRLLLCTAEPSSRLWPLAGLLDGGPGGTPLQFLGLCRRGDEVPGRLPDPAHDVLVVSQDFLLDGPALPMLERLLQRSSPPTVLLTLTRPHRVTVRAAVEAGVQGVLSQGNVGHGALLEALTSLAAGCAFLDPDCRAVLADDGPASLELTARELEILRLVAEGCTNRVIAERLQIAEVTARDHVQHILSKLQVPDRTAAAVAGLRLGYLR
jgi:DNA-binding NarL/FixJ family response regulator